MHLHINSNAQKVMRFRDFIVKLLILALWSNVAVSDSDVRLRY